MIPTTIWMGSYISKLSPVTPIFSSTVLLPWPTRMCTKTFIQGNSSLFLGVYWTRNVTPMIKHRHTLPNYAMLCDPTHGLPWRGDVT